MECCRCLSSFCPRVHHPHRLSGNWILLETARLLVTVSYRMTSPRGNDHTSYPHAHPAHTLPRRGERSLHDRPTDARAWVVDASGRARFVRDSVHATSPSRRFFRASGRGRFHPNKLHRDSGHGRFCPAAPARDSRFGTAWRSERHRDSGHGEFGCNGNGESTSHGAFRLAERNQSGQRLNR
jgi:hypothetical protein